MDCSARSEKCFGERSIDLVHFWVTYKFSNQRHYMKVIAGEDSKDHTNWDGLGVSSSNASSNNFSYQLPHVCILNGFCCSYCFIRPPLYACRCKLISFDLPYIQLIRKVGQSLRCDALSKSLAVVLGHIGYRDPWCLCLPTVVDPRGETKQ